MTITWDKLNHELEQIENARRAKLVQMEQFWRGEIDKHDQDVARRGQAMELGPALEVLTTKGPPQPPAAKKSA